MNDERLFEQLAAHAGPADVDPGFEDHLYAVLQREMRRTGRVPRPIVLLAAALLLALAVGAAALVGSGLVRLPDLSGGSAARLAYGIDGDIYVADWDGTNPVRIADGVPPGPGPECNFWGEGSMWSPDGRYFAYRSGCGNPGTVYLHDAEGNPVTSFPGYGWLISWSPDSTRVATWVEPYETIGIYGIDGERHSLLTLPAGHPVQGDYDPVWSPDGGSVFLPLAPEPEGSSEIWELPIDGGAPQRVPDEDPRSNWNSWYSPDGAQVAFVDDNGALVVAAADGTGSRVVTSGLEPYGNPLWSPTGDRIAFSWTGSPVGFWPDQEVRVVEVATGALTTLATDNGIDVFRVIGFSPEGDRILFTWPEADSLWSADADGSGIQLLVRGTNWADWQPLLPGS